MAVRLNGWKEIAAHLGKSVRTVQRWERDYGLPVHRLGREGGEIIWVDAFELDAWIITQSAREASASDNKAPQAVAPPSVTLSAHVNVPEAMSGAAPLFAARRQWPAVLVLGLVIVVAFAGQFWWRGAGVGADATDWRIEGGSLVGLTSQGIQAWKRDVSVRLDPASFTRTVAGQSGSGLVMHDVDGDGRREILLAASNGERLPDASFHVLRPDGTDRFPPIRPMSSITFGSTKYHGPWAPHHAFVTTADNGEVRIHASFIHVNEFPTLLLTLDPAGRVISEYWSNGYVESVNAGSRNGKRVWLVGATNNDTKGASLAVFDTVPHGSAPAAQAAYVCRDCGPGGPVSFLVMPRRCIAPALGPNDQATATLVYMDSGGQVFVHVSEGPNNLEGKPRSEVIYSFDPALSPTGVFVASGLLIAHRDLEKAGVVDHAWSQAEEETLFPIQLWDARQFVELPKPRVTY
jgi:hypothetical protein